jgi:hypothetical protein
MNVAIQARTKFNLRDTRVGVACNSSPRTFIVCREKARITNKGIFEPAQVGSIRRALKPVVAIGGKVYNSQGKALYQFRVIGAQQIFILTNKPVGSLSLNRIRVAKRNGIGNGIKD